MLFLGLELKLSDLVASAFTIGLELCLTSEIPSELFMQISQLFYVNSHYSVDGRSEIAAVEETSLVFTIVKHCCLDLDFLPLGLLYDAGIYIPKPGVGKLELMVQLQVASCLYVAHRLRIIFAFLNVWEKFKGRICVDKICF